MDKKFLLGTIAFTMLLIAAAALSLFGGSEGQTAGTKTSSGGGLAAREVVKSFGTVAMKDGHVFLSYEVTNSGSDPVAITKLFTSCMCTRAQIKDKEGNGSAWGLMPGHGGGAINPNMTVGAGETVTVIADFDPAAHGPAGVGAITRQIVLETNSVKTPKLELTLSGTVVN